MADEDMQVAKDALAEAGIHAEIKHMDIATFRERGYLHEVNRLFLHPLGMALEVHTGWTREEIEKKLKEAGVQFGSDAIDNIVTFVHTLGLDRMHLSGIWDYRDDPEGIVYGDPPQGMARNAARIEAEAEEKASVRMERFGFVIQPIDQPMPEGS